MTSFLYARGIRIFDYARFADPPRERIRAHAQQAYAEAGGSATLEASPPWGL